MKKTMKALLMTAICLIMIFAFTACSTDGEEDGGESESVVYKVGTEPTYPPFDTTDEDGNVTGFDMDLIQAIGEDQGFDVEFQTLKFASLIPSLKSGSTDIVIAGMNITEERAEVVDFSDPYYDAGVVILVNKDNDSITGWASFTADTQYKVAAQTGTTQADSASALLESGLVADAVMLDENTTALEQLTTGNVDAVLVDKPVAKEIVSKQGEKYKLIDEVDPNTEGKVGIAVSKDNTELLGKINTGLKNVMESGKYDELCEKWGL